MKKKWYALLLGLLLAGSVVSTAEEVIQMDDIVVTGERFENNVRNVPKNITVITADELSKKGAKTLVEALEGNPGIVCGDYNGNGKSSIIDIRGQGEAAKNNVLVLVDGISANSIDMSGADFSTLALEQIERIEVMPGGGVLYGDKAVGGVINVITKKKYSEGLIFGYQHENGSYGLLVNGGKVGFKLGNFLVAGTYYKRKNDGYRKNSDYKAEDYSFVTEFGKSNNKINITATRHSDEYGMPGALSEVALNKDRTAAANPLDRGKTRERSYKINHILSSGVLSLESFAGLKNKESEAEMVSWGLPNTSTDTELKQFGSKLKIGKDKSSLIFGVDYSDGKSKNSNKEINKQAIGLFTYDKLQPIEGFSLIGGYRREDTTLKYYTGNEKKFSQDLYEFGTNIVYSQSGSFYATFSQNYRTPVTDEYYEAMGNHWNENLLPQKADNIEVGIKDLFVESIKTTLCGYINTTKDEIYYNTKNWHNENMPGTTKRTGIEAKLENYILDNVTFTTYYSYMKTEITDGIYKGKEIPGVPNYTAGGALDIAVFEGLNMNFNYNRIGEMYSTSDFNNAGGKTSEYGVLNFRTSWNLFDFIELTGGIKNMLDTKYSEITVDYGYGRNYYPSPEKNYYFGVKVGI